MPSEATGTAPQGRPPLAGLRVVEISAFVAAPLGGMSLSQLGADVIRIDPVGGGMDHGRWPLAPDGTSLYWASLNKGKRAVSLALDTAEGRDLARRLICAPGADAGILLTNLPPKGWLSYVALRADRPDLIMLRLTGNFDGSSAVDYTVNPASGFPVVTGNDPAPVNHVLPAWDVIAGMQICVGLLAAERARALTGAGQEITLALSDVMLSTVSNLGYLADVQVNGTRREPLGNGVYGAFGRDFPTADGRRVMLVALTDRQWNALCSATGLADKMAMIGPLLDVDLATEGGRFVARDAIAAVLTPWCAARTLAEIAQAFAGTGVLWSPYRDFAQMLAEDARCSLANPMFGLVQQLGAGDLLAAGSPLRFGRAGTPAARPAPRPGEHSGAVLAECLGLGAAEIGRLREAGIVGH